MTKRSRVSTLGGDDIYSSVLAGAINAAVTGDLVPVPRRPRRGSKDENPSPPAGARGSGPVKPAAVLPAWRSSVEKDEIQYRIEMPGVGKEDVKVTLERNGVLVIEGGPTVEEEGRRYVTCIDLEPEFHKVDQIKAEMKNGLLKIGVPKLKQEERGDVVRITVD